MNKKLYYIFIGLLVIIACVGCQEKDKITEEERNEHTRLVIESNHIDGVNYRNDYLGIKVELAEDYTIYQYEDLNFPEDSGKYNLLLYASDSNSDDLIYMMEALYDGEDYLDEAKKDFESFEKETGVNVVYQEDEVWIDQKEVTCLKVQQVYDEDKSAHFAYYFLRQKESLITIMITYNPKEDINLSDDILKKYQLLLDVYF